MVSFTNEQNIICSQTQLEDNAHQLTIIRRQLFAGHVVGSRPIKRKKIASNGNGAYFVPKAAILIASVTDLLQNPTRKRNSCHVCNRAVIVLEVLGSSQKGRAELFKAGLR